MFRQDVKLLELVQSLPELVFAQTVAGPPSHHLMHRRADLSRQFCRVHRGRITDQSGVANERALLCETQGLLRTGSGYQI
jgi:hypothetical protein